MKIPIDSVKPTDGRYKSKESLLSQIDRKKEELDGERFLAEGEVAILHQEFAIEYTYDSNPIEGQANKRKGKSYENNRKTIQNHIR